jgi:hypothetical protein
MVFPRNATAWFAGRSEKTPHIVFEMIVAHQAEVPVHTMCQVFDQPTNAGGS